MLQLSARRIPSLDGLRGLAALVVVIGHTVMASSHELVNVHYGQPSQTMIGWLLGETPLHLLWAGDEAVIVFFVLSGFVLALPTASGREFRLEYYPRRLLRLYAPTLAALGLGAALYVAITHSAADATTWLGRHTAAVSGRDLASDAVVVRGGDFQVNPPLWSLRWEVLFSVLLPAYLLVARFRRSAWVVALASVLAVAAAPNDYMRFLPVFMLGVLLAYSRPRLPHPAILASVALAGLSARWWVPGTAAYDEFSIERAFVVVGAAASVALPLASVRFDRFLTMPAMHWAGTRSFSIYLVHVPLVIAVALLLNTPSTVPLMVVAIPGSLLLAEAFYRLVELPSHRLSRRAAHVRIRGLARADAGHRPVRTPKAEAELSAPG